ncbi:Murein DD-endopeptidase MepM and murein hydrolase activator NlpD, contain LysM domain [Ruminococcus sp. YRD2003]|uniref:murein hydrolase activator EnvC family protein n=1 Tax=Ruminococcus sp. YRD2003 TaxID=1452313 RepID=UPI0008CFB83A|nr:Murein DD-endopeptidase MepM and murein hydrolase activator NlpD, contain LysM domain [Ruminococcus flavefaciens]
MRKLTVTKKILTFLCCAAVSVGAVAAYPAVTDNCQDASAKTIQEIQEERKANNEKIAALQLEIDSLEGDKNNERAYQESLNKQIGCIQDNINLLNQELDTIATDINATQGNIFLLDEDINTQQEEIDSNIELFKQRLCAMYISSNESSASVILGSDSFYDMMSRVQMINRIAEYDDELIENILGEIDALEQSKSEMETEKLSLEMKLEEQEKRKKEKADEVAVLNTQLMKTQSEIDRLAREQADLERDKAAVEADNAALAAEQAEIEAEIAAAAAEAQRLEEERLRSLQQQSGGYTSNYTGPMNFTVNSGAAGLAWPVPGHSGITSYYGYRWGTLHGGIDISDGGIMGAPVVAARSGTVIRMNNSCSHNYGKSSSCGCGNGYGNYVAISHDGTYSTLYGHLTSAAVSVGDYVEQGQVIGYVGSTGWSTGEHLHFEVYVNGVRQDPMGYVSP